MGADRSYVETNRRELDRLKALVERASDEDLRRPMDDGWTVASVLGHMAFWDLRIVTALERWGPDGTGPSLSDDLLAKNEATGLYINTDRADHRGEHLDEIERLLPPA